MFAIAGTVPLKDIPLLYGIASLENEHICVEGENIPISRGTSALIAASIKVCEALNRDNPSVFIIGDIGKGDGSLELYKYLAYSLPKASFNLLTFHYILPNVLLHNHVLGAIQTMPKKPILIADAGFMYVAKMSGYASKYDLFTPDIGELAFLADEKAPHPLYTRGFLLHMEDKVPDLINLAYKHNNAAKYLLVKGERDFIANKNGIIDIVDSPMVEALEPIGGTGDTITGIVSALVDSGMDMEIASVLSAKANRLAGLMANPTPASSIMSIINKIGQAIIEIIK